MIKSFKSEMYKLLNKKSLYISVSIGVFFSIWLLCEQLKESKETLFMIEKYGIEKIGLYYPDSLYNHFIGLDYWHKQVRILYMLFPMLASLPYSSSYCNEKKSGYIKLMLTRTKRMNYYLSKFLAVFISGFLTVFLILSVSLIISMMFYPMLLPEPITNQFPAAIGDSMLKNLFINKPMAYTLLYILIDSVFFGMISLISLVIGAFTEHSFVSVVGGTVVFYIFSFVISAIKMNTCNPSIYLVPYQPFEGIKINVIIIHTVVALLTCLTVFIIKEAKKDVL